MQYYFIKWFFVKTLKKFPGKNLSGDGCRNHLIVLLIYSLYSSENGRVVITRAPRGRAVLLCKFYATLTKNVTTTPYIERVAGFFLTKAIGYSECHLWSQYAKHGQSNDCAKFKNKLKIVMSG